MPERCALHAYLTANAHEAWQRYAEENGVSVTGLIEAGGRHLAQKLADTPAADLWPHLVQSARRIDVERRRRHGA